MFIIVVVLFCFLICQLPKSERIHSGRWATVEETEALQLTLDWSISKDHPISKEDTWGRR